MSGKKDTSWLKFRHRVITALVRVVLKPYCYLKFGVRIEPFENQGNRQYMILYNHQTTFDQFFVGVAFRGPVYYVATEDIFSLGWVSDLIRWLVAPIPIRKQTTDIQAVKNCIRVAREGGTIAIAPEGNRTYSGKLCYMNPAIASLVKKVGLPIALFRIEGGYGVQPRWSDVNRKGKMTAKVSRVIEPEDYKKLTNDELMELIYEGLNVCEACVNGDFTHQKSAEYIERVMYVCPECGLTQFESKDDIVECKKCGKRVRYLPSRQLESVDGDFPFEFVADWYDYQCGYINDLDLLKERKEPIYTDKASVSQVIVYERKVPLHDEAEIELYNDRVAIIAEEKLTLYFDEVSAVTVLGRNKLNIYSDGHKKIYQLKGDKRFNALKYVNIFHRYKNLVKGEGHVEFLGL